MAYESLVENPILATWTRTANGLSIPVPARPGITDKSFYFELYHDSYAPTAIS